MPKQPQRLNGRQVAVLASYVVVFGAGVFLLAVFPVNPFTGTGAERLRFAAGLVLFAGGFVSFATALRRQLRTPRTAPADDVDDSSSTPSEIS